MKRISSLILLALAACGGGTNVNGNFGGMPIVAADTASIAGGSAANGYWVTVLITSAKNECDLMAKGQTAKNSHTVQINLLSMMPIGAGTYPMSQMTTGEPHAVAFYDTYDAACHVTDVAGTVGSVTVSRADAGGYAGTFDLSFASGDHLSGNFMAHDCGAMPGNVSGCV